MRVAGAGVFQTEGKASTKVLRQAHTPFFGSTARKSVWTSRVREEGEGGEGDTLGKLGLEVGLSRLTFYQEPQAAVLRRRCGKWRVEAGR